MSLDLSRLSPAPWHCGYEDDGPNCLIGSGALLWCRVADSPERHAATDAAFIALARNAFDVMMRRRWNAVAYDEKFWVVEDDKGNWLYRAVAKGGDGVRIMAADPFTALTEADRWYREHCEKGANP